MRGRSRGWRVGAWARGEWAELEGRRVERAEGPGMHRGPLKSAEKPRARSHGFSGGLGVAGCVRYGGGGWGLGWSRGHNRTSVGSHAGRGMKNVTNTNGPGAMGPVGGRGAWVVGVGVGSVERVGCWGWGLGVGVEP